MGEILSFAEYREAVYVFGAGVVGYYVTKFLLEHDVEIRGILVSDKKDNIDNLFGIEVMSIDDLAEEKDACYIIIATLEEKQWEIRMSLRQKGYDNIYELTEKEYLKIRENMPDISAELYQ